MKRTLLHFLTLSLIGILFFVGCQKREADLMTEKAETDSFTVGEAKSWFQKNSDLQTGGITSSQFKTLTPDWERSLISKDERYSVVECPIQSDENIGFSINNPSSKAVPPSKEINGKIHVVFLKDNKTGKIQAGLMNVFSNNGSQTERVSYRDRANFSGSVFYTTLKGDFVNGWVYENGKVVRKSGKKQSSVLSREGPGDECYGYTVNHYRRYCIHWNDGSTDCGPWALVGSSYQTYCVGTGGGGYTPPDHNEQVYENQSIIDSLAGFPCAQDILKSLPNIDTKAEEILQNVFGVSDDVNIKFKPDHTLATDIDGETTCGGSSSFFNCTVRLNASMLNSASKDYIAATFIHEAIHAYINYQRTVLDTTTFKTKFPIFWEYRGNEAHHNEMANNYVGMMSNVIRGLNPGISEVNSRALSWGGLQKTTAWRNNSDTMSIKQINTAGKHPTSSDFSTYNFKKCD